MPIIFDFIVPSIPSAGVYYFTTGQGVNYEVRFGRKQNDVLTVNLVFGVRNEEYEGEEYVLTNKGEFYPVMNTVGAIIHDFLSKNPNVHAFEFAGEPVSGNEGSDHPTKRTVVYMRYAARFFPEREWHITREGNKVSVERKH